MMFQLQERERYSYYEVDNVVPNAYTYFSKKCYCLKENGSNQFGKQAR